MGTDCSYGDYRNDCTPTYCIGAESIREACCDTCHDTYKDNPGIASICIYIDSFIAFIGIGVMCGEYCISFLNYH